MDAGWQATIAGAIAGSVGVAELIGRYRSSPGFSIGRLAAWGYVGLNAVAGFLALYLVRAFDWNFNQTENVTLWRILVAGFGAVALFRSSLFVTKVGSTDVNVGPSLVLGTLLDACDRSVDRDSAAELSKIIADAELKGLNADAVDSALPVLCLALMQNFPSADQALLGTDLKKIREDHTLTSDARMRAVIVQLAKYLGPTVVRDVLKNARQLFTSPAVSPAATQAAAQAAAAQAAEVGALQAEILAGARALGTASSSPLSESTTEPPRQESEPKPESETRSQGAPDEPD